MAFGWITALKIIPWKDVIESAPHIVKAARNLYAGAKANASNPTDAQDSPSDISNSEISGNYDSNFRKIELKIQHLSSEQESSVELIRSLAQQNVRIVEAIELLRVRTKILLITCVLLGGLLAGLVYWLIVE
ncbi:MAG: hypothetical protein KAJ31_09695 [Deltaproteobacteria bacterium]|nr:hypothetical protein [Deltaproteobacteria bacterium]